MKQRFKFQVLLFVFGLLHVATTHAMHPLWICNKVLDGNVSKRAARTIYSIDLVIEKSVDTEGLPFLRLIGEKAGPLYLQIFR